MKVRWIVLMGLLLGLVGALYYARKVDPVQYYDVLPPQLAPSYRDRWIELVAFACGYSGDLRRAEVQLRGLPETEVRQGLAEALEDAVARGLAPPVLARMAALAQAHGVQSPAVAIYAKEGGDLLIAETPTPVRPLPTPTPMATTSFSFPSPTPIPTPRSTSEPEPSETLSSPAYVITAVVRSCLLEPRIAVSLTQQLSVTLRGEARLETRGLPGEEVWLLWSDGADRAITGLRPERGAGYADFLVEPFKEYHLYLSSPTGAPLMRLRVSPCETPEENTWSSWLLTIRSTEIISP
ncbi:MAG: hypothetical protein ACP5HM_03640 [Anaerolineae bacterium]